MDAKQARIESESLRSVIVTKTISTLRDMIEDKISIGGFKIAKSFPYNAEDDEIQNNILIPEIVERVKNVFISEDYTVSLTADTENSESTITFEIKW